jgi:hypothetical protein
LDQVFNDQPRLLNEYQQILYWRCHICDCNEGIEEGRLAVYYLHPHRHPLHRETGHIEMVQVHLLVQWVSSSFDFGPRVLRLTQVDLEGSHEQEHHQCRTKRR